MPRPSKKTQKVIDEILSRLSKGEPLAEICRDEGMPHVSTWRDWCRSDENLDIAHARARDDGFDAISADIFNIIDTPPERTATEFGDKVDSGYVQWAKNRAELRLKLLAKWDPKRYGDRLAIAGDEGSPLRISVTGEDAEL